MQNLKIETERLLISHGQIEDYIKVHEYDFNYLQGLNGNIKYIKRDPDEVRSWFSKDKDIEEHYKRLEENKSYDFIVYLRDNNEPIANISFDRYDKELNALEIAAWLHPKYWGKGYIKEALLGAMEYIYSLGYDNIKAGYYKGNEKSKKLNEKIGFKIYKQEETNDFMGNETINYIGIMSKDRFNKLYSKKDNSKNR